MDKSPDAFRTISEVAVDLDLPQHVLRFWETRFVQIKPLKRGGGRRYYRPDDVELLKGIRHLLYGEGYTIRGVQRILKEQGVRFVMNVWHDGAPQPPSSNGRWDESAVAAEPRFDDAGRDEPDASFAEEDDRADGGDPADLDDRLRSDAAGPMPQEPHFGDGEPGDEADDFAAMAQRFAPRVEPTPTDSPRGADPARNAPRPPSAAPRPPFSDEVPPVTSRPPQDVRPPEIPSSLPRRLPAGLRPPEAEAPRQGIGQFLDRLRPGGAREPEPTAPGRANQSLSRDEIRRLQSTLFELLECKRLLDQVR